MLLTDTNILQRVCLGRAVVHVEKLLTRDVRIGTTVHNAFELHRNLLNLGLSTTIARERVGAALKPLTLFEADEYQHLAEAAKARLRQGGKSDWPLLAAALAMGAAVWSEDRDFFGTGVPVWSTTNIRSYQQD